MNSGRGGCRFSVLLVLGLVLIAIVGRAAPPVFEAQTSDWQFGPLGNSLGLSGFEVVQVNGGTELVFGTLRNGYGNTNDSWQVLRWDPVAGAMRQVYASQEYEFGTWFYMVRVLDVNDDGKPEIVIGRDGVLEFYDAATKALLATLEFSDTIPEYAAMADYDQDGDRDLLILTSESLYLVDGMKTFPKGQVKISELTGVGGRQFFVGQLDEDAPLEILFTWGGVIEVGSWKEEWQVAELDPSFMVRGLIDRDGDGISEILVTTADQVITLDLSSKAENWRTQVDARLQYARFQTAQLDGDAALELVFGGDKTLVVVDSATGVIESTTVFPENPDFLGLADVDGTGGMDVVFSERVQYPSVQMRIVRMSDGSSLWSSQGRGGHFDNPKLGDLDGDGRPELVLGGRGPGETFNSATGLITLVNPSTSQPIAEFKIPDGFRVLDVADADRDGRSEILAGGEVGIVGSSSWKRRELRIYKYSDGELTLSWQKTVADTLYPEARSNTYKAGSFVDLNGDGTMEIVAGWTLEVNFTDGLRASGIEAWDLATGALTWASPRQSLEFGSMCVGNLDKDAQPEVAAIFGEKWLRIWDLKTGRQEFKLRGNFTSVAPMAGGFAAGNRSGYLSRFKARRGGSARFARAVHQRVSKTPVSGITPDIGGAALWVSVHNQYLWWPGNLKRSFVIQGDENDTQWDDSSVRPEVALLPVGGGVWLFGSFGNYYNCVRGFFFGP